MKVIKDVVALSPNSATDAETKAMHEYSGPKPLIPYAASSECTEATENNGRSGNNPRPQSAS